jgi:hypothetical protein
MITKMEPKICANCKFYYDATYGPSSLCRLTADEVLSIDPITGAKKYNIVHCADRRAITGKCGPAGVHFVPKASVVAKNFWKAWFKNE